MRLFTTGAVLLLFASPVFAAPRNQEKAKEVVEDFLKALKAKDADAIMKTVGVPFTFDGTDKTRITELEELKTQFTDFLKGIKPERVPDTVGPVYDIPTVRKALAAMKEKDRSPRDVAIVKHAETVKGDAVYMVQLLKDEQPRGAVIVRIKGEKASVVWIYK